MLKFPEGFFEEEEREGFVVSSEMKHVWAAQFEMIKIYEEICKKYGIKYFAAYGTLLGAVRHQGFIPWDDDVDIMMLRDDYNKFLEVCETEMPEDFSILNIFTEPEWDELVSRVVNGRGINVSSRRMIAFHGCPYAIGVDIFALDYIPEDKKTKEWKDKLLDLCYKLLPLTWVNDNQKKEILSDPVKKETLKNGLHVLEDSFNFEFFLDGNMRNQIYCLADAIASNYGDSKTDITITRYPGYVMFDKDYRFLELWFASTITMKFESDTIEVPIGYDAALYNGIGYDYMVPRNKKGGHDYPFYKGQKQILEDKGYGEVVKKMRDLTTKLSIDNTLCGICDDGKIEIPAEWIELSVNDKQEKKKVALYGLNSAAILNQGSKVIDRLEDKIKEYDSQKENMLFILVEDTVFLETFEILIPKCEKRYHELKKRIVQNGGIISDSLDYKFYELCDEYCGDCTSAAYKFADYGRVINFEKYE